MVSIIIINYKCIDLTVSFIKNEISKFTEKINIIIVNNDASEESDLYLSHLLNAPVLDLYHFTPSSNNIFILSSKENLGFAKGNNLAAQFDKKYLHSAYLLFTNNDIIIGQNDTISKMIRKIESNPKIGMIGPKVLGLKGELQSPEPFLGFWDTYVWVYISKLFMSYRRRCERFNFNYAEKAKEGFHYKIMGSFFMMPTKVFFDCGMMDPNTFLYSEEVILSERLKPTGKGVYYDPSVSVVHAHGTTTKITVGKRGINKYKLESQLYYYRNYIHEPSWKLSIGSFIYKIITFIH